MNENQRKLFSIVRAMQLDLEHLQAASDHWTEEQCKDACDVLENMNLHLDAMSRIDSPCVP